MLQQHHKLGDFEQCIAAIGAHSDSVARKLWLVRSTECRSDVKGKDVLLVLATFDKPDSTYRIRYVVLSNAYRMQCSAHVGYNLSKSHVGTSTPVTLCILFGGYQTAGDQATWEVD